MIVLFIILGGSEGEVEGGSCSIRPPGRGSRKKILKKCYIMKEKIQ